MHRASQDLERLRPASTLAIPAAGRIRVRHIGRSLRAAGRGVWIGMLVGLAVFAATACSGDDGSDGADSPLAGKSLRELVRWSALTEQGEQAVMASLDELERRLPKLSVEESLGTVLPALERAMTFPAAKVRERAAQAAAQAAQLFEAEPAVRLVASALADADATVRESAAKLLGALARRNVFGMEDTGIPALAAALRDEARSVRLAALQGLADAGQAAEQATADVLAHLRTFGDDAAERLAALHALRGIGAVGEDVREALIEWVDSQDPDTSRAAMTALAEQAKHRDPDEAAAAIDVLVRALSHTRAALRRQAIAGLRDAGETARAAATEPLQQLQESDSDARVRELAAATLRAWQDADR